MKIGELAKLTGCSVETIRYYEHEGLLPEAPRSPDNNYRYYNQMHTEVLTFIRHCRALDMTHEEIRALLKARANTNANCEAINTLVNQHLIHVRERIIELQLLEEQLSELKNSCTTTKATQDCGILHELEHPTEPSLLAKSNRTKKTNTFTTC